MKHIAIIRHAKSSWGDLTLSDISRPLNKRGNRDAPIMADYLRNTGFKVEQILLSPSVRTRETATHFLEAYNMDPSEIVIAKQLYHGTEGDFIDVMYSIDNDIDHIIMLGHNPGITYIANLCSDEFMDNVATSGILVVKMEIDNWEDADWDKAKLMEYYYPKMIPNR